MAAPSTSEAQAPARQAWRIPAWFQDLIAAIMVPLLLAALYSGISQRDRLNDLSGEFGHLKEDNERIHHDLEKDLAKVFAWKEDFGKKPRYGPTDADRLEARLERMVKELEARLDDLNESYINHLTRANTYIERIENQGKEIDEQGKQVKDLLGLCQHILNSTNPNFNNPGFQNPNVYRGK